MLNHSKDDLYNIINDLRKEIKSDIKEIKDDIKDVRTDFNEKFEKIESDIENLSEKLIDLSAKFLSHDQKEIVRSRIIDDNIKEVKELENRFFFIENQIKGIKFFGGFLLAALTIVLSISDFTSYIKKLFTR